MATTIDWSTRVFTVYQADMTNLGGGVYELDVEALRLELHALQASEDGIAFPQIFVHNTEQLIAGTIFVRSVGIINGYSMTISPAGSYQVKAKGANHNLGDVYNNLTGPTFLPGNSAGLVNLGPVEASAFQGRITVDTFAGTAGTLYPIGTGQYPVLNYSPDGVAISANRGIRVFALYDNLTLNAAANNYEFEGVGTRLSQTLDLNGQDVSGSLFSRLNVTGTMVGSCQLQDCEVSMVTNASGVMQLCGLNTGLSVADGADLLMRDCTSEVPGTATPYISLGTASTLQLRRWAGGIELRDMDVTNAAVSVDLTSGHLKLAASCTGGTVVVRGAGHVTDNSGGAVTIIRTGLVSDPDGKLIRRLNMAEEADGVWRETE